MKRTKRFFAILLVLAMLLSQVQVVFAADPEVVPAEPSVTPSGEITLFTFTPSGNGQFTISSEDGYLTTAPAESGWGSVLACGETPTNWTVTVAANGTASVSTGSGWFNNYLVCNDGTFALNMWGGGNVALHDDDGEVFNKQPISAFEAYICNADSTKALCGDLSAVDYAAPEGVHKHNYEAVVTAPTCTVDGYSTYTCAECSKSFTADPTPAAHQKADGDEGAVTAPTCLEAGYVTFVCAVCGESFVEDGEPATGHSYEAAEVVPPTCTEDGYTNYVCSVCGAEKVDDPVKAKHTWAAGEVITAPTADAAGAKEYVCSVCGETVVVPVELNDAGEVVVKLGPTLLKDENSPTGYNAKFVYENADASEVTFAGDIGLRNDADPSDSKQYTPFEYKPGLMRSGSFTDAMAEVEDGVWFYEVPLAAGANQYWFYVDGDTNYMVPDPANAPNWSPNSPANKNAYNALYVPYDPVQDYEPMKAREAELPRASEDKGTWSYVPIEIDGFTHYAGVYLPYGYDAERAEPYKTIYILHGGGQDESDWMGIGSVQNILDNLIAEGRAEPAVLVSPTTNNNMMGGTGDAYANLFEALIPFVEENYNVSTDKMDRSLAGLSMGSMNTQNIINAVTEAEKFGYYGPWSGGASVQADAVGNEYAHMMFGGGHQDFGNPSVSFVDNLAAQGVYATYVGVTGAHDFNAWCQLFRIYVEEYLWNPAAFGDIGTLFTFTPTGTAGQYTIQTADGYLTTASAGWFGANLAFGANPANWTVTMAEDGTAALQTRAGWSNSYLVCNNDAFALNSRAAALKLYGDDGEAYTTLPTSAFEAYICIADGSKALRDDLSAADYVVPEGVHKHNYEAVVTEPTCTEGGYTTYTCADCGKSFTADAVAASHQRFANDAGVVTAPTCTEAGYVTYECAACGESFTEPGEPATGHSYDDGVVTAPTCTEDGYTTYTCTVCGDVKVSDTVKAGHSWVAGEVVAEPTETEAGAQAYACSACDAAKVVPVQLGEDGAVELKLGPTVTKDENSPTGYTVKFLYENADANTVTFAGDIALRNDVDRSDPKKYTPFEYAPGLMRSGSFTAPMDEIEDGVWYYEVPMAAGANQYWFYVNGNNNYMVPDPANHPQWSPNSNWNTKNAYNAVYVPYDPVQDYEPMAARVAELPRTDGQSGTWSYVPMEFGGRTHYAGIYLPYGYDAERAKPYKLIFTLHGSGQDESDWMGIGSVQHIMDNLVADGITEPAIIVSPTSNNSMVGGSGAGLNNLFNEVIPFLEENYNISSDPDDRAFVGLSMGAMNTMSLINAAADQFAYYAPLSGGMSVRADAPGLDKTHIFFATGWDDKTIRPNPTAYLPLKEAGFYVDYLEVTAGHDFNAWCQLFRIFLEDYAWQPAAFGDIGTEFTFTPTGNGQFTIQSGDGYLTTVSAGWSSSLAFGENPTAWNLAVAEDGTATISTGSGWFNNYLVCNNGTFALNMWGGGNVTLHDNDGEVYTKLPTSAFTAYICSADSTKVLRDNLSADDYSVAEDVHKHTYEAVVTAPTCTEDGYTTYTCAECGRSYTADPVAASHTKWANDAGLVTAPTCLEDGYISFQCAACGETFVEPGDPATGHNWSAGEVIAEPTETESGIQAYVCSGCDEVKEVPIQLNDAGEAEKKLGPTVIKDETSPTGYIAKFLYENKDANTVTFAGDIALRNDVDRTDPNKYTPFEYEPGMMRSGAFTDAMEEIEDGLWYYEVPLAAGANQYWFYVDGNTRYMVPDPANAPIWSPNSASNKNAYNAVYVPYDPVQDYEPMKAREAELPRTDGQSGTWSYVPIEFGGRTHYAGIYLPYGYDAEREEPYKLIFTLHGSGQDESDWMGIGSVQHIMDNLAAEGRTEPAIIVSPTSNNNMIGSAGDGYANLFNEILPFLEANYNISSDPEDRAFCGLSMGGGNTMSLINAAADQFAYYGPWSAGMSVRADAPGLDKTHVFFATGWDDTTIRPTPGAHQPLVDAGFHVDYLEVTAAHDFNAWCQLFRIFCEEYLWQPEAFSNFRTEDGLALGPNVIEDPESPTGYTVKFLYENDEAESVTFAGDIGLINWADRTDKAKYTPFEYKPGLMRSGSFTDEMTKREDGFWYYEVPLAAGANQYWFYIDGNTRRMVPDPANHPQWSPNSNWNTKNAYNAVYVPYNEKQDFEPLAAREAELPRATEKGTWSYVPIEIDGRTHYMGVYLPYGYDPEREEPYKTIWTLHGGGQDESDWMGIGSVQNIMDNLAAEGRTEPAIIVTPTTNNGMLGNTRDGYANLFNEVIPFVEANYNVSTDPMDRALCGLSMGSMNTQNIMNVDASAFGFYGPWSGGNGASADLNAEGVNVFYGNGGSENDMTNSLKNKFGTSSMDYKYTQVAGAHDFNTWCQLFRIFLEDYLWDDEAFESMGPKVVKDPESPTGYTVEFRYRNDEATEVIFAGDIGLRNYADPEDQTQYTPFDYVPDTDVDGDGVIDISLMRSGAFTAPMEKTEAGYWYYEVPLAAGANQYWFYVDGNNNYMVPDPANHPQWSPNSNWDTKNAYNAVYVPYDEKQGNELMAARVAELPRASQKGTWSYVPFQIGEATHYIGVYLPYGYDAEREEPYKTIYMQHGGGQDESDWMGIGSVQNIMDNLAAEGRTEPAVIISPNSNSLGGSAWGGNYENLYEIIIPFVEANYNVSSEPIDRAFAGLSMGSMITMGIINNDASNFGYYGPWSGGFSVRETAPGLDEAHIMVAGGRYDFGNPRESQVLALKEKGYYVDYVEVAGAHDFNSWCQLFRMFIEDYAWQPAAFGDPITEDGLRPGPNVIKDENSPTGYTVKFLYKNDEAETVTFAGDIALKNWADTSDTTVYTPFEYKPGLMRSGSFTDEMTKREDGYWYYEVPLAAGANQYWFYIDGNTRRMVPDPANHPQWSPNSNWNTKNAYNAVYVPYDAKQDFEPMAARAAELPRETEKGTWSYVPVVIGETTHYMGVYLPYGYDAEREEPYKTIYTLHGGGQDESDWMGIGSVQNIMDNLAAEGRTEPAIIITPTTNKGMIGNARDGYANLFNEIIPFVEANYNVSVEAEDRAFCGLSMGCTYSQQIANIAADKFGYFGPWSNAIVLDRNAENLDDTHFFFGRGYDDVGGAGKMGQDLEEKFSDLFYVYTEVAGAHDFNAWCQLFRMFLEDYLWNPEAFGDTIDAAVDAAKAAQKAAEAAQAAAEEALAKAEAAQAAAEEAAAAAAEDKAAAEAAQAAAEAAQAAAEEALAQAEAAKAAAEAANAEAAAEALKAAEEAAKSAASAAESAAAQAAAQAAQAAAEAAQKAAEEASASAAEDKAAAEAAKVAAEAAQKAAEEAKAAAEAADASAAAEAAKSAASAAEAAKAQAAAQAAQAKAEAAQKAAEEASASAAEDKAAAEAAKVAAEAAQKAAEEAKAAAAAAQAAAEEANAEAAEEAAKAAAEAAKSGASAAEAAKAQAAAQAAQAKAEDAQKAAEEAQAKADEAASRGEAAADEAEAAQKAADEAKAAAEDAKEAAALSAAAASESNAAAAEAAAKAAEDAAKVAADKKEIAAIKAEVAADRLKAEEAAEAAKKAEEAAKAAELNAKKYLAKIELALALASLDLSGYKPEQLADLAVNKDNAIAAIDAAESIEAVDKALDAILEILGAEPVDNCPSKNFTDVPEQGNWAHEGIDYAVANGLMEGIGNNLFDPEGTLTRAQLVTILYRAENEPEVEFKGVFSDVAEGAWYANAIEWAAANKIVEGYEDGTFAPNAAITREQIATILYRYSKTPAVEGDLKAFPDAASVSEYAVNAMIWATQEGIINGIASGEVTNLAPKDIATRAQIASIMMRYLEAE